MVLKIESYSDALEGCSVTGAMPRSNTYLYRCVVCLFGASERMALAL